MVWSSLFSQANRQLRASKLNHSANGVCGRRAPLLSSVQLSIVEALHIVHNSLYALVLNNSTLVSLPTKRRTCVSRDPKEVDGLEVSLGTLLTMHTFVAQLIN